MRTRRDFIGQTASAVAGLALAGAGAGVRGGTAAAVQPAGATARREVVVGGRRIKTVDVHAHCEIPGIREMMGGSPSANRALTIGPDRLRAMDAQGIDVEVLSINPFWYAVDRDVAARLIRAQNEGLAEICAANPDRFGGARHGSPAASGSGGRATRGRGHGPGVAGRLGRGERGERGAGLPPLRSVLGQGPGAGCAHLPSPAGRPGARVPAAGERLPRQRHRQSGWRRPIALSHLIFEGTLDRFPRLKLCAAHGGGYLPSYADRSDYGCGTRPEQCAGPLALRADGPT